MFLWLTSRLPHSAMPLEETTPFTFGQTSLKLIGSASATENLPAKQPSASMSALNAEPWIQPLTPASIVTDASSVPIGTEPFRPRANFSRAPKSIAALDAEDTKSSLKL